MATNIDKALYQAPEGIDAIAIEEEPLEIEIIDPDAEEIEVEIEEENNFGENLAEQLSESELSSIASSLIGDFEADIASRKDWIQTYVDGLELLGLKIEEFNISH